MSDPATHASERELCEHLKEEKEAIELEKLEVRWDPHLFRRGVVQTISQDKRKQKELECERKEREVRERKEELEVRCDPHLF